MYFIYIGLAIVAVAVLGMNIVTSRSLWLSDLFDRSQKVAQTVFVWAVPGAFLFVRYLLRETVSVADSRDPTVQSLRGDGDATSMPTPGL